MMTAERHPSRDAAAEGHARWADKLRADPNAEVPKLMLVGQLLIQH